MNTRSKVKLTVEETFLRSAFEIYLKRLQYLINDLNEIGADEADIHHEVMLRVRPLAERLSKEQFEYSDETFGRCREVKLFAERLEREIFMSAEESTMVQ